MNISSYFINNHLQLNPGENLHGRGWRFIDLWVKGYKTHAGVSSLKSVSVHIFICTCIFIQAGRDEYFPYGAFPGMRRFQSLWDLSGLVLNTRSDGDTGRHE